MADAGQSLPRPHGAPPPRKASKEAEPVAHAPPAPPAAYGPHMFPGAMQPWQMGGMVPFYGYDAMYRVPDPVSASKHLLVKAARSAVHRQTLDDLEQFGKMLADESRRLKKGFKDRAVDSVARLESQRALQLHHNYMNARPARVNHQGWLERQEPGFLRTGWNRHLYALDGSDHLSWWPSDQAARGSEPPMGTLNLWGYAEPGGDVRPLVEEDPKDPFLFRLTLPYEKKPIVFRAQTADDVAAWVRAIGSVVNRANLETMRSKVALTADHLWTLFKAFRKHSSDGRSLSEIEFRKMIVALSEDTDAPLPNGSGGLLGAFFNVSRLCECEPWQVLDIDRDRRLSFVELSVGMTMLLSDSRHDLRTRIKLTFAAYDLNGSGSVDRDELTDLFRQNCNAGIKIARKKREFSQVELLRDVDIPALVDRAFALLDTDKDGRISLDELEAYIRWSEQLRVCFEIL